MSNDVQAPDDAGDSDGPATIGVEQLTLLHPVLDSKGKQRRKFLGNRANFKIDGQWVVITEIESDALHAKVVAEQHRREQQGMPAAPLEPGTRVLIWRVPLTWCSLRTVVTIEAAPLIERVQLRPIPQPTPGRIVQP